MPFLEVALLFCSYSVFLKILIPLVLMGVVAFLIYSNSGININNLGGIFSELATKISSCLEYIRRLSGK
jgi:hypothetical protein